MEPSKRDRLARGGWESGSAADFLGLSPEEVALINMKLALADHLRALRTGQAWTQTQLAQHLGSSQSRVAKMEAADRSASLDLLVKGLLTLGASPGDVGRVISNAAA